MSNRRHIDMNRKIIVSFNDGKQRKLSLEQRIKRLEEMVSKLIVDIHYDELVKNGVIKNG